MKIWFLETRPQFLILSVVLAFLGASMAWAWNGGSFSLGFALLAGFGLVLTHIAVNTLNDYFDFKSGIDLNTIRTPFSGGSGILPPQALTPKQVFWLGMGALILSVPIGVYFIMVKGWLLLPLLVIAAFCVVFYSPLILRAPWPEWAPGVGLGILPVMGAFFVQTSGYTWPALIASVPSGILVHNLLFLNEFPDVDADTKGGRKTTPILIGKDKAAMRYSALTILVCVWIVAWVITGQLPYYCLLALLTIPFAVKAIRGSFQHRDMSKLVPAQASNVMVVLLTQLLLGIGFVLARIF